MPRCVPGGSRAARSKRLLRRGERLTSAALLRLPKLPPPVYKLLGRMGSNDVAWAPLPLGRRQRKF